MKTMVLAAGWAILVAAAVAHAAGRPEPPAIAPRALPAFSGAEGYGCDTPGGRGGIDHDGGCTAIEVHLDKLAKALIRRHSG